MVLDNIGFDKWAGDYDQSIDLNSQGYPFEGYYDVLGYVASLIPNPENKKILDIGIGTGLLSFELYKRGANIFGIDFSAKMLERTRTKMPYAHLFLQDISKGLPHALEQETFDYIISSYTIHHLTDHKKIMFFNDLQKNINQDGLIIIADIAFQNKKEMELCKSQYISRWDHEEEYIVADKMIEKLTDLRLKASYQQISQCGGVLVLKY